MNDFSAALPIQTIRANGLDFAYYESGSGPLVILLHGFPDTALGWRPVAQRLAAEGFRVVAPFLRGYSPTDLAPDGDYSLPALARDLLALIEHLGHGEKVYVVGHDWGSVITQFAANLRPDRFEKIVLCSVPHLRRFLPSLLGAQRRRSHYIFRFQAPLWAERVLPRDDFAWMVQHLVRDWSPGWAFTDADLEPIKANFRDPARLKAALAYYRAMPALMVNLPQLRIGLGAVQVPTRMLHGSRDGCIGSDVFTRQEKRFKSGFECIAAPHLGHFLQHEDPAWVAGRVLEFIRPPA